MLLTGRRQCPSEEGIDLPLERTELINKVVGLERLVSLHKEVLIQEKVGLCEL
jgi:hypothetical protein